MKKIDRAILILLAVIFLFSSIDKLMHYDGFVNALRSYIVVPRGWAVYLAVPMIAVELMIGVGLFVRPWRRQAALTAAAWRRHGRTNRPTPIINSTAITGTARYTAQPRGTTM